MEYTRIVLLYFSCLTIGAVSKDKIKTVEEGSSVTLPCLSADKEDDYYERSWYDGCFDEPQGEDSTLFKQESGGKIVIDNGSPAMSVNENTFSLVIGAATLGDNNVHTCYVCSDDSWKKGKKKKTWDYIDLQVYILPVVRIRGLRDDPPYTEGDKVMATCTIERIYPKIHSADCFMTWGDSITHGTVNPNKDGSYKCVVTITKTLTMHDDNKDVKCKVKPNIWPTVPEMVKTLKVEYGAHGVPSLSVSDSDPLPGYSVTFECSDTNVKANPEAHQVNWTKDGVLIKESFQNSAQKYVIDEMSREDNGTYQCQVGNKHGFSSVSNSILLNVNYSAFYAPKGTPGLSVNDSEPMEGDSVIFNCSSEETESHFPVFLVNWTKNGEPITDSAWTNETVLGTTLAKGDSGNYSCSVGNKIGFSVLSEPVNVNVLYGPFGSNPILRVNIDMAEEINSGDYVTFTCTTENITSNPQLTIVKWTKNGEDCKWPDTAFNHTTQVTTTGNYSCMVGNHINGAPTYSNTSEQVELKVKVVEESSFFTSGIVGGIVGGFVLIILVVVIIITVIVLQKRRMAKSNEQNSTGNLESSPSSSPTSENDHEYANVDMSRKEPVLNYAYLDFPNQSRAPSPTPLKTMTTDGTDDAPTDYVEVDWEKTEAHRV